MIEEGALVEVGVVGVGPEGEHLAGHLEHVIDVAGLRGAAVHAVAQLVGFAEILILAVPASGIAVVLDDLVPEETCGVAVAGIAGVGKPGERADHLRHLGVTVIAGEIVLVAFEGLGEGAVLELIGEGEPAGIGGVGVEVGKDLVHAAELGIEHALDLGVGHPADDALRPLGVIDFELQRRRVASEAIGVAQAGVGLVQRVPR